MGWKMGTFMGISVAVVGVMGAVAAGAQNADYAFSFAAIAQGIVVALLGGIMIMKMTARKMKLPPGPVALPVVGNWLQVGNDLNHRSLAAMAQKYGDVFMLKMGQKNFIVVSSPEAAKEVLHTQGVEFASRTRNAVFDIFTGGGQDIVFTNYSDHWRRMRRIMTVPFFTNKAIQSARLVWEDEVDHVVAALAAPPASATTGVVVRPWLQLMMYNIMYRTMFNSRFAGEEDPLYMKLRALNVERCRLPAQNFKYNYGDFIPVLRPFLKGYLKICQDVRDRRLALFKEHFVDERRKLVDAKGAGAAKCAIDHILEAQKKGEISEDNVLYLIENINVAAIESTLMSLEWGIAELVNHPEIQTRIRDELDRVLGDGNLITEPDTHNNKLPYLSAVVKETMRLHMPIPLLVPHMNAKPAKLAGYDIPAESKVLVNAWWIGNNPELWDRPATFMPERFLLSDKNDKNAAADSATAHNDFRFLPFGAGRRSCPGVAIAMPLMAVTLGRIVQTFELHPPPGMKNVDVAERGGQFGLHISTHSTVVAKPRSHDQPPIPVT